MILMLILARLALATVFGLAGVSKLMDPSGSRRAVVDFGAPKRLATPIGLLLPTTELIVALGLLPVVSARYAAVGSLLLLSMFLVAIVTSLLRGRAPDCHCFGQIHSEPIGWPTIIRNLVLVSIGAFIVWQGWTNPGPSILTEVARLTLGGPVGSVMSLVLLLLVALATWFLLRLVEQSKMFPRLAAAAGKIGVGLPLADSLQSEGLVAGLPLESPAPNFRLEGLAGENVTLVDLLSAGKPLLLLFTHPGCGPCLELMPQIGSWQREHEDELQIVVVSQGSAEANLRKTEQHQFSRLLLQADREVAEAYKIGGTPGAVIVRPNGLIGSQVALGPGPVWQLIAETIGMRSASVVPVLMGDGLPVDSLAPAFSLPDLDGAIVSLDDLVAMGTPLLTVFMNPAWPPSSGLLQDVATWCRDHGSRLHVTVIGEGDSHDIADRGPVQVLFQAKREVAEAYRVYGTPAALIIRPDGRIGSPLALGADAIRLLVGETVGPSTRLVQIAGTHHGHRYPASPQPGFRH